MPVEAQGFAEGALRDKRVPAFRKAGAAPSLDRSGGAGHIRSLGAFGTLGNLEFDLVAFLQTLIAFGGNGAVVNEDVWLPILPSDKPIALGVVKPLDGTFQTFHWSPLLPAPSAWG
jgi:hypothetical protein